MLKRVPRWSLKITCTTAIAWIAILNSISLYAQRSWSNDTGHPTTLRGQVFASDGHPISDVHVELRALTGGAPLTTVTGSDGSFEFDNLPRDSYEVTAMVGTAQTSTMLHVSDINPDLRINMPAPHTTSESQRAVNVSELRVPAKAKKHLDRAADLFQKKHVEEARKEVNSALDVYPQFAAALTLRGVLSMGSNHPSDAERDFAAAINIDPGYNLAYVGFAANDNMTGRFDEALKIIDASKRFVPQCWQLHLETSKALLGKNLHARALEEANQAATLFGHPSSAISLVRAKAYLALHNNESAIKELKQYVTEEANGPQSDEVRRILTRLAK